jgi:arsenate reductase
MTVTIYHNPKCGKSRQTLPPLREKGVEAKVVEYLKTPLRAVRPCNEAAPLERCPRQWITL